MENCFQLCSLVKQFFIINKLLFPRISTSKVSVLTLISLFPKDLARDSKLLASLDKVLRREEVFQHRIVFLQSLTKDGRVQSCNNDFNYGDDRTVFLQSTQRLSMQAVSVLFLALINFLFEKYCLVLPLEYFSKWVHKFHLELEILKAKTQKKLQGGFRWTNQEASCSFRWCSVCLSDRLTYGLTCPTPLQSLTF